MTKRKLWEQGSGTRTTAVKNTYSGGYSLDICNLFCMLPRNLFFALCWAFARHTPGGTLWSSLFSPSGSLQWSESRPESQRSMHGRPPGRTCYSPQVVGPRESGNLEACTVSHESWSSIFLGSACQIMENRPSVLPGTRGAEVEWSSQRKAARLSSCTWVGVLTCNKYLWLWSSLQLKTTVFRILRCVDCLDFWDALRSLEYLWWEGKRG